MTRSVNPFVWVALGFAGCSFSGNSTTDATVKKDASLIDAMIDARTDCTLTCTTADMLSCGNTQTVCPLGCSSTGGAHCAVMTPSNGAQRTDLADVVDGTGDLTVTADVVINSDTGKIDSRPPSTTPIRVAGEGLQNGIRFRIVSATVAVISFDDVTVATTGSIRVTGSHALIILARHTITIAGEVDADGGRQGDRTVGGPGGGDGAVTSTGAQGCGFGEDGTNSGGAGGGAGGAFGGSSGKGGSNAGGAVKAACALTLQTALQGGSGGGRGGDNNDGGDGGGGGGGLQFSAYETIVVSGTVHANGMGGSATINNDKGGGGGGGSGGGFLFEAPSIDIRSSAVVVTNGGGGGDGTNKGANNDGAPGGLTLAPALGAGSGGNGGAGTTAATNGTGSANNGGSGGGGSIGKIEIRARNTVPINAIFSPVTPLQSTLTGQ